MTRVQRALEIQFDESTAAPRDLRFCEGTSMEESVTLGDIVRYREKWDCSVRLLALPCRDLYYYSQGWGIARLSFVLQFGQR
jgi:hypothetical protein